jgi:hypothetical protein
METHSEEEDNKRATGIDSFHVVSDGVENDKLNYSN